MVLGEDGKGLAGRAGVMAAFCGLDGFAGFNGYEGVILWEVQGGEAWELTGAGWG